MVSKLTLKSKIQISDAFVWTGKTIQLINCSHDFIDKVSLFGIFDLIAKKKKKKKKEEEKMLFWPCLSD